MTVTREEMKPGRMALVQVNDYTRYWLKIGGPAFDGSEPADYLGHTQESVKVWSPKSSEATTWFATEGEAFMRNVAITFTLDQVLEVRESATLVA